MNYPDHETIEKILSSASGLTYVEREALEDYQAEAVSYWQDRVWCEREAHDGDGGDCAEEGYGDAHPFEAAVRRVNAIVQNHISGL